MNTFAAESAAWKLAGIGQDIATEARAIASDIKRGDPETASVTKSPAPHLPAIPAIMGRQEYERYHSHGSNEAVRLMPIQARRSFGNLVSRGI
jgi:hypothetical protein